MSQAVLRYRTWHLYVLVVSILMLSWVAAGSTQTVYAQSEPNSSIDMSPTQSGYVSSFFPDSAFGGAQTLPISYGDKYTMVFLQFDLSSLPQNVSMQTATLSATVVSAAGEDVIHPHILIPQADWCADTLTWSTKPPLIDTGIEASSAAQINTIDWDVKSLVDDWRKNPKSNKGIVLGADSEKFVRELAGISGPNGPKLSLTFEGTLPTTVPLVVTPIDASPSSVLTKHPACNVAGAMSSKRDKPNPLTTPSAWMYAVASTAAALSAWVALKIIHELAYAKDQI